MTIAAYILALASVVQPPLVQPTLNSATNYHYFLVGTNFVEKGEVPQNVEIPAIWQYAPRFSNYGGMAFKGMNSSLLPCIRGMNFKSPVVRTEDMMWLNEAWWERVCCTRDTSPSSGLKFPLSPILARSQLSNPTASGTIPWIISAVPTNAAMQVFTERIGDTYPSIPSYTDEFLIELFEGDYSDPQLEFFSNAVPIACGDVITLDSVTNVIAYFTKFSDKENVIVPNVGSVEESTQNTKYYAEKPWFTFNVSYNSAHIPQIDAESEQGTYTNSVDYTTGPMIQWESDREKWRCYYMDEWNANVEIYTKLTEYDTVLGHDDNTTETITEQRLYLQPTSSSNIVCRGGLNRLNMGSVLGIHRFICRYEDIYNTIGQTWEGGTESYEEKSVFVLESESGRGILFDTVTNRFVITTFPYGIHDYAFESSIDLSSMMQDVWAFAFPTHAYGKDDELEDPPEADYSQTSESLRKYGGSVIKYSGRWTRHTVLYDGVWVGCSYFDFRTKGR